MNNLYRKRCFCFLFVVLCVSRWHCNAAVVRDQVVRLRENNLDVPVPEAELIIDFERCLGFTEEELLLNVSIRTKDNSIESSLIKIVCEGVDLEYSVDLLQIIPSRIQKHTGATCEAPEPAQLLEKLLGREAESLDALSQALSRSFKIFNEEANITQRRRSLSELSDGAKIGIAVAAGNTVAGPIGAAVGGAAVAVVLAFGKESDTNEFFQENPCLPANGLDTSELIQTPLNTSNYCYKYIDDVTKLNNITVEKMSCENEDARIFTHLNIIRNGSLLCFENAESTGLVDGSTVLIRWQWMENQYNISAFVEEGLRPAPTLDYLSVSRRTEGNDPKKADLISYKQDSTQQQISDVYVSERYRQIATVGPYDKQRACIEAQAHFAFVHGSARPAYLSGSTTSDEQEFVQSYYRYLRTDQSVYVRGFEKSEFKTKEQLYAASKRHQGLVKDGNYNILPWQWDPPCFVNSSLGLETITRESHALEFQDCNRRMSVSDNRCKVPKGLCNKDVLEDDGVSNSNLCLPHFVQQTFPGVASKWFSSECIALDEQEFFCGLADENKFQNVLDNCFPEQTSREQAQQALMDSLWQRWSIEGDPLYPEAKSKTYKELFCSDGELPNENDFYFRPFLNLSSPDIQEYECPCACRGSDTQAGMRVCPLNPWNSDADGNNRLGDLGLYQGCVRNRGASVCMPYWSPKYLEIPFDGDVRDVQNRCDAPILKNFQDRNLKSPSKFFGDVDMEVLSVQLKQMNTSGYTCTYNSNQTVPEIIVDKFEACSNKSLSPAYDWIKGKRKDNFDVPRSQCFDYFWYALRDTCINGTFFEEINNYTNTNRNLCKIVNPQECAQSTKNWGARYWLKQNPFDCVSTGEGCLPECKCKDSSYNNKRVVFDHFGENDRRDCFRKLNNETDMSLGDNKFTSTSAKQYFPICNKNFWDLKGLEWDNNIIRNKMLFCYEVRNRVAVGNRWQGRSKESLQRILSYIQEEYQGHPAVQELRENFYRWIFDSEEPYSLLQTLQEDSTAYLDCTHQDKDLFPDIKLRHPSHATNYPQVRLYGVPNMRFEYKAGMSRFDVAKAEMSNKNKGVYDGPGRIECMDSYVQIHDFSSYKVTLHELTLRNLGLASELEKWFHGQTDVETQSLVVQAARQSQKKLFAQIDGMLESLSVSSVINGQTLQTLEDMFQQNRDITTQLVSSLQDLEGRIIDQRAVAEDNLGLVTNILDELSNSSASNLDLYRASVDILSDTISTTFGLLQSIVKITSQTREVVSKTQGILYSLRYGDQHYRRHTQDIVSFIQNRWITGGNSPERPYIPFVARTPAVPPGKDAPEPRIEDYGALPKSFIGKSGILPVKVVRGWSLQQQVPQGNYFWVQHRFELVCGVSALLSGSHFDFTNSKTWTGHLGPRGCVLEEDQGGVICDACRVRMLTSYCEIMIEGQNEEWRKEYEQDTLYNLFWTQEHLNNNLEDFSAQDARRVFDCAPPLKVPTTPKTQAWVKGETSVWSLARPLPRLEVLSGYSQPTQATLERYLEQHKALFPNSTARVQPNNLTGRLEISFPDFQRIPAVGLLKSDFVGGLDIADKSLWNSVVREVCLNPTLWVQTPNSTDGSDRMVLLSSRGYDNTEHKTRSVLLGKGISRILQTLNASFIDQYAENVDEAADLTFLYAALQEMQKTVCGLDFAQQTQFQRVQKLYRNLWSDAKALDPTFLAPFEDLVLYPGFKPSFLGETPPLYLSNVMSLSHALSEIFIEGFQELIVGELLHELRAAKAGMLPAEGLQTSFKSSMILPQIYDPLNKELSAGVAATKEMNLTAREEQVLSDLQLPASFRASQVADTIVTYGNTFTNPLFWATTEATDSPLKKHYNEGKRCFVSRWVSTSKIGLPVSRLSLLNATLRVRVEPANQSLRSDEWKNYLSGVRVLESVIPLETYEEFQDFYWVGNLSCLWNDECDHVYDTEATAFKTSPSTLTSKPSDINSLGFWTTANPSFGPLYDWEKGNSSGPLRSATYEEWRSQYFRFVDQTPSFAKQTLPVGNIGVDPSRTRTSILKTNNGLRRCVGTDVHKQTCRFLGKTKLQNFEGTLRKARLTVQSALSQNQRGLITAVVSIPHDLSARAIQATAVCPVNVEVVAADSTRPGLKAYFAIGGTYEIVILSFDTNQSCHNKTLAWTIPQENIEQGQHFFTRLLSKGYCLIQSVAITSCGILWEATEQPPSNISSAGNSFSFGYSLQDMRQKTELVSLMASFTKAEAAWSFLLQQTVLQYGNYQLEKIKNGWRLSNDTDSPSTNGTRVDYNASINFTESILQEGTDSLEGAQETATTFGQNEEEHAINYTETTSAFAQDLDTLSDQGEVGILVDSTLKMVNSYEVVSMTAKTFDANETETLFTTLNNSQTALDNLQDKIDQFAPSFNIMQLTEKDWICISKALGAGQDESEAFARKIKASRAQIDKLNLTWQVWPYFFGVYVPLMISFALIVKFRGPEQLKCKKNKKR